MSKYLNPFIDTFVICLKPSPLFSSCWLSADRSSGKSWCKKRSLVLFLMSFFHCMVSQQSLGFSFHLPLFIKCVSCCLLDCLLLFSYSVLDHFWVYLFLNVYMVHLYLSLAISPKSFIPQVFFFQGWWRACALAVGPFLHSSSSSVGI